MKPIRRPKQSVPLGGAAKDAPGFARELRAGAICIHISVGSRDPQPLSIPPGPDLISAADPHEFEDLPLFTYLDPDDGTFRVLC